MSGAADMSAVSLAALLALLACVGAFAAGFCLMRMHMQRRGRNKRLQKARGSARAARLGAGGLRSIGLDYAADLHRRLLAGQTVALSPMGSKSAGTFM